MMPDEINEIPDLETAIYRMNAAIERARRAEERATELAAENAILKGQLCQCKVDRDYPDLA